MLLENKKSKRNVILTIVILSVIAAVATVLVVLTLVMQKGTRAKNADLSADSVVTGVIKKLNYQNKKLSPLKENVSGWYSIPDDTVTDYAIYLSDRSGTEIEFTCFKLKDSDCEEKVMSCINDHLKAKEKTFSEQNRQSMVSSHYPYIFVAVSPDSSGAINAFETVINETPKESSTTAKK